jgi:flagellar biosynthesis GTPase FlhF
MSLPSRCLGLFVAALLVCAPSAQAQSKESRELKRRFHAATRLYEALEYEKALDQLRRARNLSLSADDSARVAIFQGLVLADLGKQEAATAAFVEGLSLNPEAKLPVKVSPKVQRHFEQLRAKTQGELAKLEAEDEGQRRKEQERLDADRKAAEEQARAEAQRKADEEARLIAQRKAAEEAQAMLAAERKAAQEAQAQLAAERKAAEDARLEAQRRDAEDARRREEARQQVARADVPTAESPAPSPRAPLIVPAPREPAQEALADRPELRAERSTPATPYVLAGVAVLAGGVGGYFGVTSKSQAQEARDALFQDDTLRHLENSKNNALAANVLMGAAGAALVGSIITFITMDGDELPATVTAQEGTP